MDRQLEGGRREGLWHGVGRVSTISCSCNHCVLLQGGQSCGVGSIVCNGDVARSIQAASCWNTLDIVGHGIDGGDWTALEKKRGRERERESIVE